MTVLTYTLGVLLFAVGVAASIGLHEAGHLIPGKLYDVKVTSAQSKKRADGKWDVTLEVDARKLYADGKGVETETPLDEAFDVGVFTAEPGKKEFTRASVLSMGREHVHTGKQTLTIVVDQEPKFAGVDPYNKYVDRNADDNVQPVEKGSHTSG